ncbi:MAG: DUF433 domain-containing protein [Pseudomonadota bacterium]
MLAVIQKWGESQGLHFTENILDKAHLSIGDEVEVSVQERQIIVKPRTIVQNLSTAQKPSEPPKDNHEQSVEKDVMPVVATRDEHITVNENNVPMIAGTNTKVVEIALDKIAYGWSPEEILFQHPYLTRGQIYSALAYYWDHQKEIDREIEQQLEFVERQRQASDPSPFKARLKAKGLI